MRRESFDLSFLHHVVSRRPRRLPRAIADCLRSAIAERRLPHGARLPSSRQLARDFRVSRNVVLEAYALLAADGLLVPNRGGGTTISCVGIIQSPSRRRKPPTDYRQFSLPLTDNVINKRMVSLPPCLPDTSFLREDWQACWRWASLQRPTGEYGDPRGEPLLREEIARHLAAAKGMKVHQDQIIVTNGAIEAISLATKVLATPRSWVAVENPGWNLARQSLRLEGHDVRPVTVDLSGLDVEALCSLRSPPRVVLLTPAHQFPLGGRLSMERRLALLEYTERHAGWIIEDDYDGEFRFDLPPLPTLAALAQTERIVYVDSFSKTITPQLRIGYATGPAGVIEQMARLKAFANYHAPLTGQLAVAHFMKEGLYGRHLNRMRRIYTERRSQLAGSLSRFSADLVGIHGGLHVFWRFLSHARARKVRDAFVRRNIHLLPVSHFADGRIPWNGFVMGFANASAERVIRRIAEMVTE